MRIAFVTAYPPAPIHVRAYSLVRQLAREHDVTAVALCHSASELEELNALHADGIHTIAIKEAFWKPVTRAATALFSGASLQVRHGAAPALRREVRRLAATQQVDLVHVEHLRAVSSVRGLGVPVIWDAVDCISQLYRLGAQYGATPMMRWLGDLEAGRAHREEQRLLTEAPHIVVTSARERDALLGVELDGERARGADRCDASPTRRRSTVHVVANGVDADYFAPMAMTRAPDTVVFSGKMSFHANVAACQVLVREIMPLVWQRRPGARLVIAGANPPRYIRALAADPRIVVTGFVPDLRPYIGGATVAVCPTPYAVGIQNKVLEALAMGVPVVAMPAVVGGLRITPGRELLVAESAGEVADAILRLMAYPEERKQLARNGRRYVLRHHSWRSAAAQLVAIYEAALGRAHQPQLASMCNG